ncbi:MAG: hypothetical protein ACO3XN_02645 [Chthoniobacterales bacterium]
MPIVAAERRSEPAPPASGTVYLARALPGPSADRAPAAMAPALPASRQSLIVLEAEELRIRRDPALTREERMRKLRDIWQRQLAVMGKTSA